MALYKRGGIWWMRFHYQGKQIRRSTETTNKHEAERFYGRVMGLIDEGKWFDRPLCRDKRVNDMLDRYLREHSAPNKAAMTHRRDQSLAAHLRQAFGTVFVHELRPAQIAAYKASRRAAGAAPKTVNDELGLLRHTYKLALLEWEWVTDNPVLKVKREKVRTKPGRWLTPQEEERLLAVCPTWLREIIVFALHTGLRQSEILRLEWSHVDLTRRTLLIVEQKNGEQDTLPVNATAIEVLERQARLRSIRTPHVFFNHAGKMWDARNLLRAFYVARRKAGIAGVRFHDLRHTFASRLVQAGVDLYTVQRLGRWKSIKMVQHYGHHYPESLRGGVEVLDQRRTASTIRAQSVGRTTEASA